MPSGLFSSDNTPAPKSVVLFKAAVTLLLPDCEVTVKVVPMLTGVLLVSLPADANAPPTVPVPV